MKRIIESHLVNWANSSNRKVMLLRGARQVGKTYSVRKLAENFSSFLEVNFEEERPVKDFFKDSLNPETIIEKLSAYYGTSIKPSETLLFFDEIQACPDALRSLRFFYEKMPELHLIAAGSLLEFAVREIPSFGVGRISSLYLYPLSFVEFLMATGRELLAESIGKSSADNPMDDALHHKLLEKLRIYLVIGGMPGILSAYTSGADIPECQVLLDELLTTLKDDFAKYKKRSPVIKLQETFQSTAVQAGNKFTYSKISTDYPGRDYKESLELLSLAGLVQKVIHSSSRGIPPGAEMNIRKFKVIPFDTGLHQRMLGLDISRLMTDALKHIVNKGSLVEAFAGLEIVRSSPPHLQPQLFYWHREAKSSNAEVDYVIQRGERIIPIEVKSGTTGQMQSMSIFLKERGLSLGIRISQENFSKYDKIQTLPAYAVGNLFKHGEG
jgi:predicted AAA+ superfamily ATPase